MPRDRHQNGWVEETGKKVKKWNGRYYVYLKQSDGAEHRKHRSVILGLKAQMRKWEANTKLEDIIERQTGGNARGNLARLHPHDQPGDHQQPGAARLRERPACDIDKFALQVHPNALAKASRIRSWTTPATS